MKTPHPYADILRAIADGETVQWKADAPHCFAWSDAEIGPLLIALSLNSKSEPSNFVYRIKPRTIRIGDVDVPEPMREAPAYGSDYWVASPTAPEFIGHPIWRNDPNDNRWLSCGLCYSNKADAEIAGRAIFALFTKN